MEFFDRKKKKEDVPLSQETAKQMLSNVFAACDYEANNVPLEVLQSYSNYRKERYLLQKIVIVLVVIAFLLLPVLFITATVEINWVANTPPGSPVVQISTRSVLPVESITATVDGYALEVYQAGEGIYQVHPNRNGTLLITVTLVNKQYTRSTVEVDSVDVTPPVLVSSALVNDELEIFLADDSGELDFQNVYAVDRSGKVVYPVRYSTERMSVVFAYPDTYLNIFVPDKCKNTLQLILTIK